MMHATLKKIIIIFSLTVGGGIGYYFTHTPVSTTTVTTSSATHQQITIDEYDPVRDEQEIKNLFYADYYWLYPDTSYNVETHVGFTLKYRAPNENPLYVGSLQVKVLHVNNQFAGFTAYYKKTLTEGMLLFLAIKKEYRKRGFGEKLARYAVQELKKMGSQKIVLVTRANNPAQKIYRRIGFEEISNDGEFKWFKLIVA